jgi:hypothetical protein
LHKLGVVDFSLSLGFSSIHCTTLSLAHLELCNMSLYSADRKFKSVILLIDESDLLSAEILVMLKNVIEEVRTRYSYPVAVFLVGREDVIDKLSG